MKIKPALSQIKKITMAKVHNENHEKPMPYFLRFRVKKLRHSEKKSDKNCYLYRSTRLTGQSIRLFFINESTARRTIFRRAPGFNSVPIPLAREY